MAIDFPASPTNGQEFTSGSITYIYNGTGWVMKAGSVNPYLAAPFDAMAYSGMQINGSMEVSQELGAGGASISNGVRKYIKDGWAIASGGSQVLTAQHNANAPSGLNSSIQVYATTANSSPASGDYCMFFQLIEGYRASRLAWGGPAATPITLGFWFYSSRIGLYSGSIQNNDGNRSYPFSFNVIAANTFEYKTISIPGDTAGAWKADNTIGFRLNFCLLSGTNFLTSSGSWVVGNYLGVTGTTNLFQTTSDFILVTGVVVLPGIQAPTAAQSPLIMRPYDQELMTCKRYWQSSNEALPRGGSIGILNGTSSIFTANVLGTWSFMCEMRAVPTLQLWTNGTQNQIRNDQTGSYTPVTFLQTSSTTRTRITGLGFPANSIAANTIYSFDLQMDARL